MKKFFFIVMTMLMVNTVQAQQLYEDSLKILMRLDSIQNKDTVSSQSIMFLHKEKNMGTQFHYSRPRPDYTKTSDQLGNIRDRVVRKRREGEGRPLQPISPFSNMNR